MQNSDDVLILGGGVSGLIAGIELAKKDLPKSFFKRFLWKKRLRKSGVNII